MSQKKKKKTETKRTRRVIGSITIQGHAHWRHPREWSWPHFDTDFPWTIKDMDVDNGVMTVEFYDSEDESEE